MIESVMFRIPKYPVWVVAIIVTLLGIVPAMARDRDEMLLTQYYEIPSLYNPAAIGITDMIRLRATGRFQDVGVDEYPKSVMFSADMPLNIAGKKLGLGVTASQITGGALRSLSVNLLAGYKFGFAGGELTAGLQLGYGKERFKGSIPESMEGKEDVTETAPEEMPMVNLKENVFDLGAGLFFTRPRFWGGVSVAHLNSPVITFGGDDLIDNTDKNSDKLEVRLNRTAYLMGDGNIPLGNSLLEMMPSVMVKSDFNKIRGAIDGRLRYRRLVSAGLGYRFKDAVVATLAVEYKGFFLGYSFDYPVSSGTDKSHGSHEIVAGYGFKLNFSPKHKNKYKSIRIM